MPIIEIKMTEWPSKESLMKIMEEKDMDKINSKGGIEGIMKKLKTGVDGISKESLQEEKRLELFVAFYFLLELNLFYMNLLKLFLLYFYM